MTSRKSRLPPSKHHLLASNEPPFELSSSQHIARIAKLHGNSLYTVELPSKAEFLVELPSRFRNAVWVRRGGYVVVETEGFTDGKVNGEIMEIVRDEKQWRKMNYWFFISLNFANELGRRSLKDGKGTRRIIQQRIVRTPLRTINNRRGWGIV